MDLKLSGKKALVAGASQGLGRAIAETLFAEGAHVAILSRSLEKLKHVKHEMIQKAPSRESEVRTYAVDIKDGSALENVFKDLAEQWGGIDILLANAGGPPVGSFDELSDQAYYEAFETNFMGTVRLIRGALPFMRQRQGGRIGIITSQSVKEPIPGLLLSNSIRAGVTGLARTLANEVAKDHILVNCFAPGRIDTERVRSLDEENARRAHVTINDIQAKMTAVIPLGRYGQPDELARVVTFYLSFANTYVTGQTILIDGGKVGTLL